MKVLSRAAVIVVSALAVTLGSSCGGGSMSSGSPAVALSTNSLAFPDEAPGAASPAQAIIITNSGTAVLKIEGITVGANFQEINDCGSQVTAGAHCTINVTFVPVMTGDLHGAITVADDAPGNPHSITLSGRGTNSGPPPPPTLTGYCAGTITVMPNKCALVQDLTSCPVGRVAAQPGFVTNCLPPTTQYEDGSTLCQGKTKEGLTIEGHCVVAN
jgi:hypothetical protein